MEGALDLFLRGRDFVIILVLGGSSQPVRGHDEFPAGKPAAGVDHNITNAATRVIKNYVIYLADLFVIDAITFDPRMSPDMSSGFENR